MQGGTSPETLEVWHVAEVRTGCMSLFQQQSLGMAWVSVAPWMGLGDRLSLSLELCQLNTGFWGTLTINQCFPPAW